MKTRRFMKRNCPQRLEGVRCEVNNCAYHDGDESCCAPQIKVGPFYATAYTDTICATYRPREIGRKVR